MEGRAGGWGTAPPLTPAMPPPPPHPEEGHRYGREPGLHPAADPPATELGRERAPARAGRRFDRLGGIWTLSPRRCSSIRCLQRPGAKLSPDPNPGKWDPENLTSSSFQLAPRKTHRRHSLLHPPSWARSPFSARHLTITGVASRDLFHRASP